MNLFYAPLAKQLMEFIASTPTTFHVPGHNYGQVLNKMERILQEEKYLSTNKNGFSDGQYEKVLALLKAIMMLDTTELNSTDDLHDPVAGIAEARKLAAKTFGADQSYFLVGGSTAGNIALLLATCEPGDTILVQRNVHKSIINGLKLAGANAVFLMPEYEPVTKLMTIPSLIQLEKALQLYPHAKAVFLTNPNYYGIGYRLEQWVELVHRFDIPLLVDEAHGAHYSLHEQVPSGALEAGADAVVQSTHKTLTAMTMSAMLHIQGDLIDRQQISDCLAMIQSSSPSFPQMISLDIARAIIDVAGKQLLEQSLNTVQQLTEWIEHKTEYLKIVADENIRMTTNDLQKDPLRILMYDTSGKFSGLQLQRLFEAQNCWVEMADLTYVVFVIHLGTEVADIDKLKAAIEQIDQQLSEKKQATASANKGIIKEVMINKEVLPDVETELAISLPVSFDRKSSSSKTVRLVHLEEAVGKVAAEAIIPYPPGIPLLYEGEIWTDAHSHLVKQFIENGAKFQGSAVANLQKVKIFGD
ncbi:aminotransferase class I/II-fold pyridoxal phosphate-dependent enzyme [Paenibacillus yanchengensis]|uniref:Aminotransferase class I/II-fold pyridoxal phosphate-dependent enzyme n=1 Tax=Paenibacillus yanchengensis TaxID=2035833 RepID=A0ABW4YIL3_9BACL